MILDSKKSFKHWIIEKVQDYVYKNRADAAYCFLYFKRGSEGQAKRRTWSKAETSERAAYIPIVAADVGKEPLQGIEFDAIRRIVNTYSIYRNVRDMMRDLLKDYESEDKNE